ncbi:hypothetical protein BGX33_000969 [Mortierella sp. NVP41]|nr:hypothetical protein BGX33_000969 [Mortierella sp. NVP41]
MTKAKSPRRGASPPASSNRTTTINTSTNTNGIGAAAAALHAAMTNGSPSSDKHSSPPPSPKHLRHNHSSGPTAASKEVNHNNNNNNSNINTKNGGRGGRLAAIVTDNDSFDGGTGHDRNPFLSTSTFSSSSSSSPTSFASSTFSTVSGATSGSLGSTTSSRVTGGDRTTTATTTTERDGGRSPTLLLSPSALGYLSANLFNNLHHELVAGRDRSGGQQESDSSSSSSEDSDMDDDDDDSSSESDSSVSNHPSEDEDFEEDDDDDDDDEEDSEDSEKESRRNRVSATKGQQRLGVGGDSGTGGGYNKASVVLLADQTAEAKWRNWSVRTLWTLIMIGGFFACFAAGPMFVILLVVMVQGLVYKEVIYLAAVPSKEKKLPWFRSMNWYFLFSTNYFFYGESLIHYFQHIVFVDAFLLPFATHHRFISFTLYVIGFVFFVANLKKGHYRFQFSQFAWTHMTLLLVVCQSHFIINNIFEGLIWFFLPASLVIANDIWAYIFGFFMGKTPLIKLSPKKTVEGFVGGWIMTIVFGMLFATLFLKYPYMICPVKDLRASAFSGLTCDPNPVFIPVKHYLKPWMVSLVRHIGIRTNYVMIAPLQWHVIIMACFASLIAPFGGFFASGFKRAFKIKDFGQSIPGHGGITDRMDCQFLMGLFSYMYYQSFIKSSAVTTGLVLQAAIKLKGQDQMELFDHLKQYLIGQGLLDEESCVIMPPKEAWVS